MHEYLKDSREALVNVAKTKPTLYGLIARIKYDSDALLRTAEADSLLDSPRLIAPNARTVKDTEIVIEGFPRSGNTFSVHAFGLAQGRPVKVAHHLHAPAQIMIAVRLGIPAILLVRDPEGAVLSRAAARVTRAKPAHPRVGRVLSSYTRFYESVLHLREDVVVAVFDDVIRDFGTVIDRVNARYGTTFQRFEHTQQNVQRVFELIDLGGRRARPATTRQDAKRALEPLYHSDQLSLLRASANRVYATITSAS